jgi:hypothetical protein
MEEFIIEFDIEKSKILREARGIGFEEVAFFIENDLVLDIIEHPSSTKYKGQSIFIIEINNYIYCVPSVFKGNKIFLKTLFPSRKLNKIYKKKKDA